VMLFVAAARAQWSKTRHGNIAFGAVTVIKGAGNTSYAVGEGASVADRIMGGGDAYIVNSMDAHT